MYEYVAVCVGGPFDGIEVRKNENKWFADWYNGYYTFHQKSDNSLLWNGCTWQWHQYPENATN